MTKPHPYSPPTHSHACEEQTGAGQFFIAPPTQADPRMVLTLMDKINFEILRAPLGIHLSRLRQITQSDGVRIAQLHGSYPKKVARLDHIFEQPFHMGPAGDALPAATMCSVFVYFYDRCNLCQRPLGERQMQREQLNGHGGGLRGSIVHTWLNQYNCWTVRLGALILPC
ncbi:hypothetical protein EDB92DRAFT_1844673 [Lactarius akahatsu]|uniref:Uncharacterized protein n=1 Tax=Lactarius akahatsu TaxID=416441 RepID=A0AAD4LMT4_9AGAM|nr:hypothetical protein EDB92DRAFT_1844673 [Lactarius akahatsu]